LNSHFILRVASNYLVIFIISINLLFGQGKKIYKKLGVTEIEEYVFDVSPITNKEDSILVRKVILNSSGKITTQTYISNKGRITSYNHYYKNGKLSKIRRITNEGKNEKTTVAYKYNRHGHLILKKRYANGSITGKEFFSFDSKNRLRQKTIKNFSFSGKKKFLYIYNEKGQKVKEYSPSKDHKDLIFEYDDRGNEVVIHKDDKKKGKVLYVVKEYNDLNKKTKEKQYCASKFYLPGIKAKVQAIEGDIWIRKYKYDEKGLLIEVRQWLNNILVGMKKIKYKL